MFDYIHTDIKDRLVSEILTNPLLDFISPVSITTGEINPMNRERKKLRFSPKVQYKAEMKNITVSVTNGTYINLQGSIHECFHGNNSGDFTFSEVKKAIENICSALNIDSGLTPLHNLEFGVNIILPFPVVTFLDSIYSYKGQRPERIAYSGKGLMIKFFLNQYELKLYDKGICCLPKHDSILVKKSQNITAKIIMETELNKILFTNYNLKIKI